MGLVRSKRSGGMQSKHSGRVPVLAHSAPGLRLPQALEKNREEENTARATRHLPGIATCDREAEALLAAGVEKHSKRFQRNG